MPKRKKDALYDRLINTGLKDPFIRVIVGMVVIAAAASYTISTLGNGTKAVITLALALAFGVVLVVLRTLIKNVDSPFVKTVCFASTGAIMLVFVTFALLLIPAATICWPQPYLELLSLPKCEPGVVVTGGIAPPQRPFKPRPYAGTGIAFNSDNGKFLVLVFYRPERQDDAELIVGALLSAGYGSKGLESGLNEVDTPNRQPDTTLVKTTTLARPIVEDVIKVTKFAIPVKATFVSLFPDDAPLQRGNIQIDLF